MVPGYAQQIVPTDDYGSADYPAYKVGYELAKGVRITLGLGDVPIESMRDLVEIKLGIPVVQAELPKHIAGATISISVSHSEHEARGIVLNTIGANENVWVRRATLAHELGHLLFDPIQQLERVRVDTYQSNGLDPQSGSIDYVEQRANAFAIAFLAPMDAVRDMTATPIGIGSLESVMSGFGISHTAAIHHVCNAHYRQFPLPSGSVHVAPTDEQKAAEESTLYYFPIEKTPDVRRGRFAGLVDACFESGYVSIDSAAQYLSCSKEEFLRASPSIRDLYELSMPPEA